MDGATLVSLIVAAGALASSVGGVAVQLRRSDPENVKILKQRVEGAEVRATAAEANVERLRDQLLATEGRLFAFERLAGRRGWDITELQDGADDTRNGARDAARDAARDTVREGEVTS